MTFNPRVWYPIAMLLAVANVAFVATGVGPMSPWHAMSHAALAVAFASWAQRLRQRRGEAERQAAQLDSSDDVAELENEVNMLRQELVQMQERVDFAERILAQRPEAPRMEPPQSR